MFDIIGRHRRVFESVLVVLLCLFTYGSVGAKEGQRPVVPLDPPLQELMDAIDTAYSEGNITQDGVYNSLQVKVINAQKNLNNGDIEAAIDLLSDLKSEIRAQSGKFINASISDDLLKAIDETIQAIAPQALLRDDFNETVLDTSIWYFTYSCNGSGSISFDGFVMTLTNGTCDSAGPGLSSVGSWTLSDGEYIIEISLKDSPVTVDPWGGFRIQLNTTDYSGYTRFMNYNNGVQIHQWDSVTGTVFSPNAAIDVTQWHTYRFVLSSGMLELYVDGALATSLSDNALWGKSVYLSLSSEYQSSNLADQPTWIDYVVFTHHP